MTANALEVPTADGPVPISALVVSTGLAGVPREGIKVVYPHTGVFYQRQAAATDNLPRGQGERRRGASCSPASRIDLALTPSRSCLKRTRSLFVLPPLRGVARQTPRFRRAYYFDRQGLSDELRAADLGDDQAGEDLTRARPDRRRGERLSMRLVSDRMYHFAVQQPANNSLAIFLTPPADLATRNAPRSSARRRGSTGSTSTRARCGSTGCASSSGRGSSGSRLAPPLRRLRRLEHDRAARPVERGGRRPRHARALPRLADAAPARSRMPLSYLRGLRDTTRTSSRPGARST